MCCKWKTLSWDFDDLVWTEEYEIWVIFIDYILSWYCFAFITQIKVIHFYFTFFNVAARKLNTTYVAYIIFLLDSAGLNVLNFYNF